MSRVFVDTNVPMYSAGTAHPLKEPCQRVITAIVSGELDAVTDAGVFQEILYRYLRSGDREKGYKIFDHFHRIMLGRILPVEAADVLQARALAERYPALSPRDLIHLAVMLHHEIQAIVSADTGFDTVTAVRRLDPAEFAQLR